MEAEVVLFDNIFRDFAKPTVHSPVFKRLKKQYKEDTDFSRRLGGAELRERMTISG